MVGFGKESGGSGKGELCCLMGRVVEWDGVGVETGRWEDEVVGCEGRVVG